MPLVRARCQACTLPLGDPPACALTVVCGRCGLAGAVRVTADGQPTDFDPAFSETRLMAWLASARVAMASGSPGIAVGACAACASPLVLSSRAPLSLPCPHCGDAATGTGEERLVDQWTEPWTRVEGGGIDLEYRLGLVEARTGLSAGCAVCGAPTPATDTASVCARCGSVTWVERAGGRVQLGVRIDGTRDRRPFKSLVPVAQGEALLRADAVRGTSGRSGTSLLSATGVGCATAALVVMLLALAIWLAAHFSSC